MEELFGNSAKKDGLTIKFLLSIRPVFVHFLLYRIPVVIRHVAPKLLIQFLHRYFLPLHS